MEYDYRMSNLPAAEHHCVRCGAQTEYQPDVCALCMAPLCYRCWDEYSVCRACERIRAAADALRALTSGRSD